MATSLPSNAQSLTTLDVSAIGATSSDNVCQRSVASFLAARTSPLVPSNPSQNECRLIPILFCAGFTKKLFPPLSPSGYVSVTSATSVHGYLTATSQRHAVGSSYGWYGRIS